MAGSTGSLDGAAQGGFAGRGAPQRRLVAALIVAALVLLADQASKLWVLDSLGGRPPVEITSFFDLVLVMNRGVSFGMFNNSGSLNALAFSALAAVIVVALLIWLWRGADGFVQLAIGLIIGGAVGNVADRLRLGAVVDFLDFHLMDWHFPAFNIADSAICVGVALLLIDGLLRRHEGAN